MRNAETGILVCEESCSFKEKIEVLSGCEDSVTLRGGLRRDFRETVIEASAPGASFVFLARGGPVDLGRMNWFILACNSLANNKEG